MWLKEFPAGPDGVSAIVSLQDDESAIVRRSSGLAELGTRVDQPLEAFHCGTLTRMFRVTEHTPGRGLFAVGFWVREEVRLKSGGAMVYTLPCPTTLVVEPELFAELLQMVEKDRTIQFADLLTIDSVAQKAAESQRDRVVEAWEAARDKANKRLSEIREIAADDEEEENSDDDR